MSTNYPNNVDSYTVHQDGGVEDVTAADVNNLQDAVVAIEQTLGSGSTKPTAFATENTIVERDANGASALNAVSIPGLTGAVAGGRFVGFIAGGPPTTGTFSLNDVVIDTTNKIIWVCTTAGSPGTWVSFNWLRIDANAPNPQTVQTYTEFVNGINTNANKIVPITTGLAPGLWIFKDNTNQWYGMQLWNDGSGGTGYYTGLTTSSDNNGFAFLIPNKTNPVNQSDFTKVAGIDSSGNATFGTVTSNGNVLSTASSSGIWTPAGGSLNIAAGTVINVASVPSNARMFYAGYAGGYGPANAQPTMLGATTTQGSVWTTLNGSVVNGYASTMSGTGSGTVTVCDGSYSQGGYYQLNNGYLQFVATTGATASGNAQNTIRWAVG